MRDALSSVCNSSSQRRRRWLHAIASSKCTIWDNANHVGISAPHNKCTAAYQQKYMIWDTSYDREMKLWAKLWANNRYDLCMSWLFWGLATMRAPCKKIQTEIAEFAVLSPKDHYSLLVVNAGCHCLWKVQPTASHRSLGNHSFKPHCLQHIWNVSHGSGALASFLYCA